MDISSLVSIDGYTAALVREDEIAPVACGACGSSNVFDAPSSCDSCATHRAGLAFFGVTSKVPPPPDETVLCDSCGEDVPRDDRCQVCDHLLDEYDSDPGEDLFGDDDASDIAAERYEGWLEGLGG